MSSITWPLRFAQERKSVSLEGQVQGRVLLPCPSSVSWNRRKVASSSTALTLPRLVSQICVVAWLSSLVSLPLDWQIGLSLTHRQRIPLFWAEPCVPPWTCLTSMKTRRLWVPYKEIKRPSADWVAASTRLSAVFIWSPPKNWQQTTSPKVLTRTFSVIWIPLCPRAGTISRRGRNSSSAWHARSWSDPRCWWWMRCVAENTMFWLCCWLTCFKGHCERRLCYGRTYRKDDQAVRVEVPFVSVDLTMCHREFAESTILTIAHRLRTVIDYDRVRFPLIIPLFVCEAYAHVRSCFSTKVASWSSTSESCPSLDQDPGG